ncbi:MAG: prenyltransferase [Cellvibrionaceae bacterium]|nr:prenyltransferase [Cellvibrionaceae bacterium]
MTSIHLAVLRAARPAFLLLTPICVLLGIAAALHLHGKIAVDLAVLVMVGAIAAHIAANTFNEYFDFTSGLDSLTQKTPFSGGSGALPAQPRAQSWVLAAACVSLGITIIIGLYLATIAGPALLALGVLGVVTIVVYTRVLNRLPWLCLVAPGAAFGPLMVLGTYLSVTAPGLVTLNSAAQVLLLALVPFFVVNNLLLLNQFPDVAADRQVGRKTFPIRYGLAASLHVYRGFLFAASAALLLAVLIGAAPWLALFALLPLALGYRVYLGVHAANFSLPGMLPSLGQNVAAALLTPLCYAAALLIHFWWCGI